MDIKEDFPSVVKQQNTEHSKLFSYLATNYDISNLAHKIQATNKARMNVRSLRNGGGLSV